MESNRAYISYSQFALFKLSPKAYYEKYVINKKTYGTKYQDFGKKLMEDLEFDEIQTIPKELRNLTRKGENVVEFELAVRPRFFQKDLFGIIDVLDNNYNHFNEIKTGKNPWTESKVMKDEQMLFYALMINLKFNVIPTATLVWAETIDDEDIGIEFTGRVEEFKRDFTLKELDDFLNEIKKVCDEIEDYEHTVFSVENSVDSRLLKLMSEKKRIEEELDLLKAEIMLELNDFENKYAESENFNITLAKRKSWTYSDELTDEIKKGTDHFKKLKSTEEKEGKAKFKETKYLLIKAKK